MVLAYPSGPDPELLGPYRLVDGLPVELAGRLLPPRRVAEVVPQAEIGVHDEGMPVS
jgi:hypothetical protein